MIKIDNKFSIGQTVYVDTDVEQVARKILYIMVGPDKSITYGVRMDGEVIEFWDFELSEEKKYN
jgi:hypothetical protein